MSKAEVVRFMRIPFFATGIKVTAENMDDIARWCEGNVVRETASPFVRVPVVRATHNRQTEGRVGMWVIRTILRGEPSFKVYDDAWLHQQFSPMNKEALQGMEVIEEEVIEEEIAELEERLKKADAAQMCSPKSDPSDAERVNSNTTKVTPSTFRKNC